MKTRTSTKLIPIFSGLYESIWTDCEPTDEQGNILQWGEDYEINYKELKKDIIEYYISNEEYIRDELNSYIGKGEFVKSIKFIRGSFWSPQSYNYTYDDFEMDITVNWTDIQDALKTLYKNEDKLQDYFANHYRSRDGFISYMPHSVKELEEMLETNDNFRALSAMICLLIELNNCSNELSRLEYEVYDHYGYEVVYDSLVYFSD